MQYLTEIIVTNCKKIFMRAKMAKYANMQHIYANKIDFYLDYFALLIIFIKFAIDFNTNFNS